MNKIKYFSFIGLTLLLIGLVGAALTFRGYFKATDIAIRKELPKSEFSEINVKTDAVILNIVVTNEEPRVELSGKTKDEVDENDLEVKVEDDELLIQYKPNSDWLNIDLFNWIRPLELIVYIPEKQYQDLTLVNNSGTINIEKVKSDTMTLQVDNGKIDAEDLVVTNIVASADNGICNLADVTATSTNVECDNGSLKLDHVTGALKGKVNNGKISVMTDQMDVPMDFKSDNGKISILTKTMPTNVQFNVTVDNGSVDIFNDDYRNGDRIGDGDNQIKLTTNNGSIQIDLD